VSDLNLVCLPFAGAGAGFFVPWRDRRDGVVVHAPQLPGREDLIDEPPLTSVPDAVEHLLTELMDELGGGEVVLFGHSLGAVLAFELAQRLESVDTFAVRHLVVSGSAGPFRRREHPATGLSDAEFLRRVRELAGYEHPALAEPEFRELILPTLRADVRMHEEYRPRPGASTKAALTSVRGAHDELVTAAHAAEWAQVTDGGFATVELPGGHMYLVDEVDRLLELVAGLVRSPV